MDSELQEDPESHTFDAENGEDISSQHNHPIKLFDVQGHPGSTDIPTSHSAGHIQELGIIRRVAVFYFLHC